MKYEIVVGAFGKVFGSRSQLEAERYYKIFVKEAKEKSESRDCQPVTLLKDGMRELAQVLGDTLRRLRRALDDPHFNLVIHTAPVEDSLKAYFLWHVEIVPRLTTPAGFELGSGILVNPCVPEEAAEFLRDACLG